jgi:hypothetical protein
MLLTILILSNFFLGILAAVAITYAVGCSKRTSEADKRRTEDISAIKETCEIATTARVRETDALNRTLPGSEKVYPHRLANFYCNFAYSAFACFRMGMLGSASLQSVKKSW